MVGLAKRMRRLQQRLLDIRLGPGAAVISPQVKRIHLSFARKMNDGHLGPRRFWHQYLPRLKYHNPAISMTIERNNDQEGPAVLSVFFADKSSQKPTSPTPTSTTNAHNITSSHQPFEEVKTINMKHRKEGEILQELLDMTDGQIIEATEAEEEQLKQMEEDSIKSEEDSTRSLSIMKERKRQAEVLENAKRSMA